MFCYNPIDWNQGVKTCEDDDLKFKELLENFEELSFYRIMNELYLSMFELDLPSIGIQAAALTKVFG